MLLISIIGFLEEGAARFLGEVLAHNGLRGLTGTFLREVLRHDGAPLHAETVDMSLCEKHGSNFTTIECNMRKNFASGSRRGEGAKFAPSRNTATWRSEGHFVGFATPHKKSDPP
ncbi:MAG: hypothetical protein Q4C41_06365 [Eggerthellaceae bacterium]|nr:hypothetical protein [Eggerthellaceae bacterium]